MNTVRFEKFRIRGANLGEKNCLPDIKNNSYIRPSLNLMPEITEEEKKYIGKICGYFLRKGERGGQKLKAKAGRGGLVVALLLFVGIPIPGTGAWTGALGASFLNMGFKSTVVAVSLGVILAGGIMALISSVGLHIFGL